MKDRLDLTNHSKGNKCGFVAKPAKLKQRTIQEIFNLAISSRYYVKPEDRHTDKEFPHMCNSISELLKDKLITKEEATKVRNAIQTYIVLLATKAGLYLEGVTVLKTVLRHTILPTVNSNDLLAIYSNWKSRPRPKAKTNSKAVDSNQ